MNTYLKKRTTIWQLILFCIPFLLFSGCHEEDMPFIELSAEHIELGSASGKQTIEVKTNGAWRAESDAQWCRVLSGEGSLYGSFEIVIDANTTTSERSANIVVKGNSVNSTLVIRQSPIDASLSVSTEEIIFYRDADSYLVNIFSNHQWNITSSSSWCSVDVDSGSNSGAVSITVEENNTFKTRKAQITVNCDANGNIISRTIDVVQEALSATINVSPKEVSVNSVAQSVNIDIITFSDWKATLSCDWITLDKSSGSGDHSLTVSVSDNDSGSERRGFITIFNDISGDEREIHTVSITQTNDDYYLELPVSEFNVGKEGATLEIAYMLKGIKCGVEAGSNSQWVEIESTDNGAIVLNVKQNNTGIDREALVSIFTVGQSGSPIIKTAKIWQSAEEHYLEIPVTEFHIDRSNAQLDIEYFFVGHDCRVEASSNVNWVDIVSTDNGKIVVDVAENGTGNSRVATVSLYTVGQTGIPTIKAVKIHQSCDNYYLEIPISAYRLNRDQSELNIEYMVSGYTTIKAVSANSWAEIISTKDGKISVAIAENSSGKERELAISVYAESQSMAPVVKNVNVWQSGDKYYLEVPVTEYLLEKEKTELEVGYLSFNCNVNAAVNASWIKVTSVENGVVAIDIDENTTGERRNAKLSIFTTDQPDVPVIKSVEILQSPTENILDLFFSDITLSSAGEIITIPVVTNTDFKVRSSSQWCRAFVSGSNVLIIAELNGSGSDREAIVTVETTNVKGNVVSKAFKVKQAWLDVAFEFPNSEYEFKHSGDTRQIPLTATGDWFLANGDNIPAWLSVSPLSGTGTTNITIEASKNGFVSPRSFDLVFENELSGKTVVLTINQSSHPDIVLGDYKYLGMGYDAAGEYASDSWVRSQILDWSKLEAADYIAGIIAPNSTEERYIYGKTIEEYQDNMTITAGVSGGFAGFTASVKTSYSEKTYTSTENEFASFRHITKKQSVKLDANVNAEQLRSCMTDVASQEINGTMDAADVIKKYGTHIITGFILGGSLDYSMTADVSSVSKEVDWKLAVEAGFQTASAGVSASAGYEDYESMRTESSNFETRLYARGGESQYASGKGTEETFQEWLRSLSNPDKWVMVDYDGSKLIPIWLMASDAARRSSLEAEAMKYIEKGGIETITTHKTFQIESSSVVYLSTDNGGDAEIVFTLAIEMPNQKSVIFGNQTSEIKLSDESGEEYDKLSYKSSEYSLSSYKQQIVKIEIKGRENDPGVDGSNDPFSRTIELIYNPTSGTWAYDGEKYDFSNKNWEAGKLNYDHNDYFWVLCTKDGTPTGHKEAVFKFRLKWY